MRKSLHVRPYLPVLALVPLVLEMLACCPLGKLPTELLSGEGDSADTPTATPATLPTPSPDVVYEGVSLSYDASLAANVEAETAEAWLPDGSPEESSPEHYVFWFRGYVLPNRYPSSISVYPVNDYEAVNPDGVEAIAGLRQLLAERPASPPGEIPFVAYGPTMQLFRSHVAYIDFQGGTGVRYVTQHDRDTRPIGNYSTNCQGLSYYFLGLTDDDRYYVVAMFPLSSPILPDEYVIPGDDIEAFLANYDEYLRDVEQQLNAQPPSSFRPQLSLLDGVIQSLEIRVSSL